MPRTFGSFKSLQVLRLHKNRLGCNLPAGRDSHCMSKSQFKLAGRCFNTNENNSKLIYKKVIHKKVIALIAVQTLLVRDFISGVLSMILTLKRLDSFDGSR